MLARFTPARCIRRFSRTILTLSQARHGAGSLSVTPLAAVTRTEYTCPMHPEVVQDHPGNCPKRGMSRVAQRRWEETNEELIDMFRRFRVSAVPALPVFILAMIADLAPGWLPRV